MLIVFLSTQQCGTKADFKIIQNEIRLEELA